MEILKKPIVKYYIGGKYHEATVSDVGDIEKLTTSIKTDLVSAINSIVSGGVGSEEVAKLKENLEKVQNDLGEIGTVNKQLAQEQGKLSEEQQRLSQEISESINKIVEEVSPIIKEAVDGVEIAQKELESIKEEYSGKITEINNNVTSAKNGIKEAQDKLEEHRAELETMEIGVTEAKKTIDEVKGTLTSFVKTSEFELSEAKIKENTMAIESNSKELSAKASQKELDHATGKISEFETSLKATAKELESKMSRQEVSEEIEKSNKYAPNLFKGTREWKDWNPSGNGVLVTSETYKNKTIVEVSEDLGSISIIQSDLKVGDTYTVSATGSSTGVNTGIVLNVGKDIEMQNSNGDTKLSPGYQRVFATFVADREEMKISIKAKGLAKGEKANITSAKLETGSKNTPWQDHADDIFGKTVIYDTSIKQMAEEISTTLKSIESIDEDVKKNTTEIKATAKGVEQVTKSVEEVGGKVTQVETDVKAVAGQVSSKISKTQLDDAIDNISLESSNQILNSDFASSFDKWSLVDKAYKLETVENRRFAFIQRSGLTADSIAALTSNAFPVSTGQEISVSFDIMVKSLAALDNKNVAYIELFDQFDKRVLRKDYSLSQLKGSVYDNKISRVGFKFKADREDVAKAKITLGLYKNGHVYFSRLNAVKGSIDSFGWTPATDDADIVRAKLETRIDQKADGVEVHAVKDSIDRVSKEVTKVSTEWKAEAGKIAQNITDATKDKVTRTEMLQETNKFSQQVTEVSKKVDNIGIGGRNYLLKSGNIKDSVKFGSNNGAVYPVSSEYITENGVNFVRMKRDRVGNGSNALSLYSHISYKDLSVPVSAMSNVTISFKARTNKDIEFTMMGKGSNDTMLYKDIHGKKIKLTNEWKIFSFYIGSLFEKSDVLRVNPMSPSNGDMSNEELLNFYLDLAEYKIEMGSLATDWSPAPEDMVDKSDYTNTVNKVSKLEQDSTGFKQTVAEVSSKVDNLSVGATNLVVHKNELKNKLIGMSGTIENGAQTNVMKEYIKVTPGEVLTFQQEKNTEHWRWSWLDSNKKYISRQADNRTKFQWTVPSGAEFIHVSYPSGWRVKLERGSVPTDYSLAPEDTVDFESYNQSVNKISKLEQDSSGFKQTVAEVESKVDGIGGRNYYRERFFSPAGVGISGSFNSSAGYWDLVLKAGSVAAAWKGLTHTSKTPFLIPGKQYVYSYEVWSDIGNIPLNMDVNNFYASNPTGTNDNDNTVKRWSNAAKTVANKWVKFVQKIEFLDSDKGNLYDFSLLGIGSYTSSSDVKIRIRNIQLEEGVVPTGYKPAFEDQASLSDLESTNTKVSQIEQKADNVVISVAKLRNDSDARAAMAHGKVLHEDVDFIKTNNNVVIYNNSSNGTVGFVRENYSSSTTNPSGTARLRFTHTGAASPGYGGFVQFTKSRPNAMFIQRWVASLPVGRRFEIASNPMGDGYKRTWLSQNQGAGKGDWEEYLLLIECGKSGSFGDGGHVYVNGGAAPTAAAPLTWYLDSATVFDISSSSQAQFAVMSDQILARVEKDGVIGSINATAEKASISFDKIEMNGKVTFNHLATDSKNKINNAESTANQIKGIVGTFDNSIINTNPIFLDWTGALPAGYASLVGSSMSKVASGNGMGNAVKFTVPASGNVYLSPVIINSQPFYEYVTIETTFMLESGTIDGAGVLFRYRKGTAILKDHLIGLKSIMPNPMLNKWYTVTKTIKQTDATGFTGYEVFPMGGWTSFGGVTAKTIQFDSVKSRPATEQEINAYESNGQINSWKKPGTTLIDGGNIFADTLKVNRLDSIAGNLGVITAGELKGKQLNVDLNVGRVQMESDYINTNGQSVHGTVTIQNGFFIGSSVKGADKTVSMITDVGLEVTSLLGTSGNYKELGRASFGSSGMYNNKIIPELNKGVVVSSVSFGDGDEVVIDSGNIVLGGRDSAQSIIHGNRWRASDNSSHLYINPKPGKSLMVKETDHTGAWATTESKDFISHGNAFFGDYNAQFTSNNGYVIVRSQKGDLVYLQGKEVRATGVNAVGYVVVRGASFANGSMEEYKEDIVKMDRSGLDMIDNSEIYNYHLKSEKDKPDRKLRTGLVIGKGYKTPTEIIDGDGVDQYSMVSLSWRAIQELSAKVNSLEEELVISDARLQIAEHKLGLKTNGKGE